MRVTTPVQVDENGLLEGFTEDSCKQLRAWLQDESVEHIVIYQCLQLDSSQAGRQSAMMVGATWTYKTLEEALDGRLGQLPSNFQYPVRYWSRKKVVPS